MSSAAESRNSRVLLVLQKNGLANLQGMALMSTLLCCGSFQLSLSFSVLQLIYMGVSLAASAWVMKWLISALDPEKENKKRVCPIRNPSFELL